MLRVSFLILLCSILSMRSAYALSCQNQSIEEAFNTHDAVFVGVVTSPYPKVISKASKDTLFYIEEIDFLSEKSWKGVKSKIIPLRVRYVVGYANNPFVHREKYLVFANYDKANQQLEWRSCDKYIELDKDYDFIEKLNLLNEQGRFDNGNK